MNLADPEFQNAILRHCQTYGFNLLCLDNLSTLASGIDENKSIDWEILQPWLLRLRRRLITVLFIHHAGRNNQMRGSSKREDPASWVLRLEDPKDIGERAGAHFISRFTKWRSKKQPKTYEWKYEPKLNGEVLVNVKEASDGDADEAEAGGVSGADVEGGRRRGAKCEGAGECVEGFGGGGEGVASVGSGES
jgi:hypothetical protein